MKSVKSFAVILMALLMLTVNVIASDVLIPNEVIMGTLDDYKQSKRYMFFRGTAMKTLFPKKALQKAM